MSKKTATLTALLTCTSGALAADVTVGDYTFDLDQFAGAAVNYRTDADGGDVDFAGKLWDNAAGVDGYTIGELAHVQAGGDPGDQLSLNSTGSNGPDWFTMTFAVDLTIGGPASDTFVFYEITSATSVNTDNASGIDTEGTSWEVSFNGGAFYNAGLGDTKFLDSASLGGGAENVNQIAFDLTSFGLLAGEKLTTVMVRNLDSGDGTSDPDFIFGGLEGPLAVVPLPPAAFAGFGLLAGCAGVRQLRRR